MNLFTVVGYAGSGLMFAVAALIMLDYYVAALATTVVAFMCFVASSKLVEHGLTNRRET